MKSSGEQSHNNMGKKVGFDFVVMVGTPGRSWHLVAKEEPNR